MNIHLRDVLREMPWSELQASPRPASVVDRSSPAESLVDAIPAQDHAAAVSRAYEDGHRAALANMELALSEAERVAAEQLQAERLSHRQAAADLGAEWATSLRAFEERAIAAVVEVLEPLVRSRVHDVTVEQLVAATRAALPVAALATVSVRGCEESARPIVERLSQEGIAARFVSAPGCEVEIHVDRSVITARVDRLSAELGVTAP